MKKYLSHFWTDPRAQVKPSPIAGRGLFAVEPIQQGEVIEIMGGVVMTEAEFHAFQLEAVSKKQAYNAIQIEEDLHLVESPEITATRRGSINHSYDSNLWLDDEVTVVTRRDITVGDELTLDYALFTSQGDWLLDNNCKCKALLCRHTVTGEDWKRADVQARYWGHFSPFLTARMAKG